MLPEDGPCMVNTHIMCLAQHNVTIKYQTRWSWALWDSNPDSLLIRQKQLTGRPPRTFSNSVTAS